MGRKPRAHELMQLKTSGKGADLTIGIQQIFFYEGVPVALNNGVESWVLDAVYTRAATRQINLFTGVGTTTRCAANEFDFLIATTLMSQLRSLTRFHDNADQSS